MKNFKSLYHILYKIGVLFCTDLYIYIYMFSGLILKEIYSLMKEFHLYSTSVSSK